MVGVRGKDQRNKSMIKINFLESCIHRKNKHKFR